MGTETSSGAVTDGTGRSCCRRAGGACPPCATRMAELWRVRGELHRAMRRRSPSADVAAEVVAETYVVVWRRLQDVPGDLGSARGWLFTTARRIQANMHRRRASYRRLIESLGLRSAREPATDEAGTRLVALEAFRSLPGDDQRLLRLVAMERPPLTTLARWLGCSEAAAASRLWRARARLTDALASDPGGDADGHPSS